MSCPWNCRAWNFSAWTPNVLLISLGGNDYNHQNGNLKRLGPYIPLTLRSVCWEYWYKRMRMLIHWATSPLSRGKLYRQNDEVHLYSLYALGMESRENCGSHERKFDYCVACRRRRAAGLLWIPKIKI